MVVEQAGKYLVVKRPEGCCVFPGGFMQWKETSEQTAQREGKEETGLDLQIGAIMGCYTTPSTTFSAMSTITIVHRAVVVGGELRGSIEGQPCWLDKETLDGLLPRHYRPIITNYLQQEQPTNR